MKPDPVRSLYSRWTIILAVLTTVAGICLSLYLRSRIAQTEATAARLTAESLRLNTERELASFSEALESTSLLLKFEAVNLNQSVMDEFIHKGMILQHAVLGPFGMAQRISLEHRLRIEKSDHIGPGTYAVVQRGPNDTWVPVKPQPSYYPLFLQSRPEALNIPVGFDFSSIPEASQTILHIERTFRTALVPMPTFFSEPDAPSYWVFAPFMDPFNPNPKIVAGVSVAILSPESLLKRVAALAQPSSGLHMTLRPVPANQNPKETIRRTRNAWTYRCPLEAIETQWLFECILPLTATGHRATATLVAGLVITALMTSQLLVLGGRTRKIEAEVLARTEDLRVANIRLEENLHDRASLEEEMDELAARERRRIGRDLHDSLGQKLTGAVFLSRSLMDWFKGQESGVRGQGSEDRGQRTEDGLSNQQPSNQQPATQQTHAKTLNETLKDAVAQVRNMARGLAPVTLNDESLGEALDQLAEEMTGMYGVSCEVAEHADLPALTRKTKEQLYLIAREAVNNAARHAQAERITIRLTGDNSNWKLSIEDDGKGLPEPQSSVLGPPSSAFSEGMGIRIMRHRASLIGAKFAIHSTPDQGTRITVKSPEGSG